MLHVRCRNKPYACYMYTCIILLTVYHIGFTIKVLHITFTMTENIIVGKSIFFFRNLQNKTVKAYFQITRIALSAVPSSVTAV